MDEKCFYIASVITKVSLGIGDIEDEIAVLQQKITECKKQIEHGLPELLKELDRIQAIELASMLYWMNETLSNSVRMAYVRAKIPFRPDNFEFSTECFSCQKTYKQPYKTWREKKLNKSPTCPECEEAFYREDQEEEQYKTKLETEDKEQITYLRSLPYREYLQSDHWKSVRKKCYRQANYQCSLCDAKNCELHVHHKTYENLGCERWWEECIVLCKECHERHHGIVKEGGEK